MGSQPYNPVIASSGLAPVLIAPGQTLYVNYTYPRSVLDISDTRFDVLKINFDSTTMDGNVDSPEARADWLSMTPANLPEGWQISLANAWIRKQISKTTNSARDIRVQY